MTPGSRTPFLSPVPRVAISYDQLDRSYRAALRLIAQLRAERDALERRLTVEMGRHLAGAQQIGVDLEACRREHRTQQLGHELDAIASSDVRIPT